MGVEPQVVKVLTVNVGEEGAATQTREVAVDVPHSLVAVKVTV
jgi:hypothetical protein